MTSEKKFHVGVKALIRDSEGKILLLKKNPKELASNPHGAFWDLPGGRIKEGHDAEHTLVEELEEELNYYGTISNIELFHGSVSKIEIPVDGEKFGVVLFVYTCSIDDHEISLSSEHIGFRWCSIDEAKKLLATQFPKEFIGKLDQLKETKVSDLGEG